MCVVCVLCLLRVVCVCVCCVWVVRGLCVLGIYWEHFAYIFYTHHMHTASFCTCDMNLLYVMIDFLGFSVSPPIALLSLLQLFSMLMESFHYIIVLFQCCVVVL